MYRDGNCSGLEKKLPEKRVQGGCTSTLHPFFGLIYALAEWLLAMKHFVQAGDLFEKDGFVGKRPKKATQTAIFQ